MATTLYALEMHKYMKYTIINAGCGCKTFRKYMLIDEKDDKNNGFLAKM